MADTVAGTAHKRIKIKTAAVRTFTCVDLILALLLLVAVTTGSVQGKNAVAGKSNIFRFLLRFLTAKPRKVAV